MVSVIIVQYNNFELTKEAIRSFRKFHTEGNYEIILADNGSKGFESKEFENEFPGIIIIDVKENKGFGAANNLGAKAAKGDVLYFLNNDTLANSEYISKVEERFRNEAETGIIGPRLLNRDNTYQLSHGRLPSFHREMKDKVIYFMFNRKWEFPNRLLTRKFAKEQYTEWVTGAAIFIRRDLFEGIGGFDENFFMFFEDKELCRKVMMREKKILYFPDACLIHLKGGSSGGGNSEFTNKEYRKSQIYYYNKHRKFLERFLLKIFLKLSGKYPY